MSRFQEIAAMALRHWFPDQEIIVDSRPSYLFGMEIDLLLPQEKLAVEVQGRQHKLFCPTMQGSVSEHQAQRERDQRKRVLMHREGLRVVAIHERDKRSLWGLRQKISKLYPSRRFPVPHWLGQAWREHRKTLARLHRESVVFKIQKGGKVVPCNRASSQWLKSTQARSLASNHPSRNRSNPISDRPMEGRARAYHASHLSGHRQPQPSASRRTTPASGLNPWDETAMRQSDQAKLVSAHPGT